MGRFKDLTGLKFGRLTVIERVGSNKHKEAVWKCRCECGNFCDIGSYCLKSGHTQSCGCLHNEITSEKFLEDLIGQKFGRLTVIERSENKGGRTAWKCRCDCGNESVVVATNLKRGKVNSCGCLNKEKLHERSKHGMKGTPIYGVWRNIKNRCLNSNVKKYEDYGGRGIKICDEWIDNFQAFYDYVSKLEHYGEEGYTLDRINNNGNYEPNNLRWADKKTQARNKRNNRIVEYNGEKMSLPEAAELSGIDFRTLWARMKRGDTGDRLFRPVEHK